MNAFSIEDLRQKAKRYLPKAVFDMADGGAEDEKSLFYNREIFNRFYFVPRVLQDVSQRLLTTPFLRKTIDLPLAIAPMGMAGLLYPKADLAIANLAYTIPTDLKWLDSITIYSDNTFVDPAASQQPHLWQNVFGVLLASGPVYTYLDIISSENMIFSNGNMVDKTVANHNERTTRFNLNVGYYW